MYKRFVKRCLDFLLSLIALIILSPVLLIVAILVRCKLGSPIIFKQQRPGLHEKIFCMYKFRTMTDAKDEQGNLLPDEVRLTKFGKALRSTSLDELPELFNILKGDMAIVGPRPERPSIAAEYEENMPEFRLRLQAKAGLTGYAQVYGKYNTSPYDKLLMDLMYISHPSLLDDLFIMFATVKILFMPESTEGVEEGQITAMDNKTGCKNAEKINR